MGSQFVDFIPVLLQVLELVIGVFKMQALHCMILKRSVLTKGPSLILLPDTRGMLKLSFKIIYMSKYSCLR
jgi:hypothetical protein